MSYMCHAVPGVHFVDFPDVIFSGEDGEQSSVGVVELQKQIICMSLLTCG